MINGMYFFIIDVFRYSFVVAVVDNKKCSLQKHLNISILHNIFFDIKGLEKDILL